MKHFTILLIAISALLSGCVVYDVPYRDDSVFRSDHDRNGPPSRSNHDRGKHDRDGDGVKDKKDRRPDDPYRY